MLLLGRILCKVKHLSENCENFEGENYEVMVRIVVRT